MPYFAACRRKLIVALVAATVAGCAPESQHLRQVIPHPGPAKYQRAEAVLHDPYPMDDVGPEIVGGRPREYQRPLNEVERARLADTRPVVTQPVPPVAPPVVAPPVAAPPYPGAAVPYTAPYPTTPAPIVTTPAPAVPPYPAVPAPQAAPFQYQQRAPY